MTGARILVVDDEFRYTYVIEANLLARGYTVYTAETGREAIELTATQRPDLVVLDVRLPDVDGFEVCRTIRTFSTVPIVMLTALTEPVDRVKGLACGADDYVPKPFNMDELIARVEAALRRLEYDRQLEPAGQLRVGSLTIDPTQRQAHVDGQQLQLTPTEYRLLCELVRHLGKVLLHDHLLAHVWGEAYMDQQYLVHQTISRLRHKIELAPHAPVRIDTEYGVGYVCRAGDTPAV